ncbi:hypothetical protein D3C78_1565920 [compost metagenome]
MGIIVIVTAVDVRAIGPAGILRVLDPGVVIVHQHFRLELCLMDRFLQRKESLNGGITDRAALPHFDVKGNGHLSL